MFWEMLPSALSQNTSPVKPCIWMDATEIPFFWRTSPASIFQCYLWSSQKQTVLSIKKKSGSASRQVLEKVFRFSHIHIFWKEDSWWLASGYARRKSIRRSGIPLVQSIGDTMLVHYLVGDLFKFCTVFINR